MFFNDIYEAAIKDTDLRRYLRNVEHMFRVKTCCVLHFGYDSG